MGIVKLHMPRFMYHRIFLPTNVNWRANSALAFVQNFTLTALLYFVSTRYEFAGPRNGVEYVDPSKKTSRIVPIL